MLKCCFLHSKLILENPKWFYVRNELKKFDDDEDEDKIFDKQNQLWHTLQEFLSDLKPDAAEIIEKNLDNKTHMQGRLSFRGCLPEHYEVQRPG